MRNVVPYKLVSLDGVRATERYDPSTHPSATGAGAGSSREVCSGSRTAW
jgi:hypothetical protein